MLANSHLGLGPTKAQSCSYLDGATRPKIIPEDHRSEAGCTIMNMGEMEAWGGPGSSQGSAHNQLFGLASLPLP